MLRASCRQARIGSGCKLRYTRVEVDERIVRLSVMRVYVCECGSKNPREGDRKKET